MSTQINPQRPSVNGPRVSALQGKAFSERSSFADKLKSIKSMIACNVPEDKQKELFIHLDELNDIYQIETQQDKVKNLNAKFSEFQLKNHGDSTKDKAKTSQKVILEIREGTKIINDIKIDTQTRVKSPQKKVQEKKFMKFEPKKTVKAQITPSFANILKSSSNN